MCTSESNALAKYISKRFQILCHNHYNRCQKQEKSDENLLASGRNYQPKVGIQLHPLSLTHSHFNKPIWECRNTMDSKHESEQFLSGILKLTVPCTRYGSNVNHHRIARGISK
ncbi:unnamed protein product [Heterobilharzia americana]|nr:unnamed protein product [Heterobilharzia americana]